MNAAEATFLIEQCVKLFTGFFGAFGGTYAMILFFRRISNI